MDPRGSLLLAKMTGKKPNKPRMSTAVNIWRKTQRDLINTKAQQLATARGADSKRLLAIRDEVARDLFNSFDEETKAFWKREAEKEHALAMKAWNKKFSSEVSTDPADRQKFIEELTTVMQPLLDMVSQATGMKGTMLMGGSEPVNGGEIKVVSLHSRTIDKNEMVYFHEFEEQHKKYTEPIFADFLKECYTAEECSSQAIPTPMVEKSLGPSPVKKKPSASSGSGGARTASQPIQSGSRQGASCVVQPSLLGETDLDPLPFATGASEAPVAVQDDALTHVSSTVDQAEENVISSSLRKEEELVSNLKRKRQPEVLTDGPSDFAEEEEQLSSKRSRIEEPASNWFSQAFTMLGRGLGIL